MENTKMCSRCVMDNDHDSTIQFDEKGVCSYCKTALENKEIVYFPGDKGKEKIDALVKQLKKEGEGKKYDCMMGISGGLDSSYLAMLGHQWGLRILGVHIDDGFDEPVAQENIKKLCEACHIELVTISPNAEQFNDLTRAFILAEVPNVAIPQDNILFACLYQYAKQYHIKTFLSGGNFALESILKHMEPVNVYDMRHIRDIHRRFGTKPMNELPFLSNYQRVFDRYLYGINSKRPLNYIDYNRDRAIQELKDFCGFEYYEMKHCENKLTKIIQLYWFPLKFHNDKRHSHFSSMIVSGQMTRDEAVKELQKPLYDPATMERDLNIVLEKLQIDRETFDEIMSREGKRHSDYKTSLMYRIVTRLFAKALVKFKG